jgi:hypothetical protein
MITTPLRGDPVPAADRLWRRGIDAILWRSSSARRPRPTAYPGVQPHSQWSEKTNPDPDYLLVMTACIDPSTGPAKMVRADPAVRLEDYRRSLRYWIDQPDPRLCRILFLENSGHPLDKLKAEATTLPRGKQVEFISMNCNDFPPDMTYGYSELRMMDRGIGQSELARSAGYLIKTTGRLTFPNLPRLLDRLPRGYEFAVDSRNTRAFTEIPQVFVASQLMIFSKPFYERHIRTLWQEMPRRGMPLAEKILWDELIPFRNQPGAILRWPINVDPVGQAAHKQKNYGSPRQRLMSHARGVARIVAPWWWV